MICTPSDITEEVDIAIQVINHWNDINAESRKIVLLPIHWSINAYPSLGMQPQKVLDKQLVDKSDMLVCVFGGKIGTPTGDYISGSVEEIEEHRKAGKPVMVFFRKNNDTSSIDIDQLSNLRNFKNNIEGLYTEYNDQGDFEKVLTDKLSLCVNEIFIQGDSADKPQNATGQDENKGLTTKDIQHLKMWVESNDETAYSQDLIGGRSSIILGYKQIRAENSREKVYWNGFFERTVKANLVERYGYSDKNKPKYRLKEGAYTFIDTLNTDDGFQK